MEYISTIAVSILGSGLLSTVIGLLANRWRHDRQADLLETWLNEGELLENLDTRAGLNHEGPENHARNLALATAARVNVNAAVASRLIPKNNFINTMSLVGGLFIAILGVAGIMAGVVLIQIPELSVSGVVNTLIIVFGVVSAFFGCTMLFMGHKSDVYRNIMRAEVLRTLQNENLPGEKSYAYNNKWIAGCSPEFKHRHKVALPADLRQAFSYFMLNARDISSVGEFDSQTSEVQEHWT